LVLKKKHYLCSVFEAKKIVLLFNLIFKKMKKLVLLLAVAFGVSLYSCGSNETAQTEEAPVEEVATEEVVAVEAPADTTVAAAVDSTATEVAPVETPAAEPAK